MAEDKFDLVGPVFNLSVPPSRKETEYLTAYKSWVYSAVSLISREVAQINLKLYRKKYIHKGKNIEIEVEEVQEHEALSLLFHTNEFMTFGQFIEITQIYLDLTGEAAWVILRENTKPSEIWPLRPDWLEIVPSKSKYIDHYTYYPGGGFKKVDLDADDVIFLKYLNPVSAYRGKGAVEAAAMAIDTDEFSSEWNRTFFFNSALPYLFFTTDKPIGEDESKRLIAMWRSKFEGVRNAHKVAFLGKGLTPTKIGGDLKELDFIASKASLRDEILATFNISKANIGLVDDVNRANMDASNLRLQSSVVRPRMISLCYYLNEFYLKKWPDENLFFDFDDPTPEDVELNMKIYDNGLKNGWLTINEVREKENLPPVEGGDQIYLPFNLQPVGAVKGFVRGIFGRKTDKEEGVITLKAKKKTKQQQIKDGLTMSIPPRRLQELRHEKLQKKIKHDLIKLVVNIMAMEKEDIPKLKKIKQVKNQLTTNGKEGFWKGMIAKTDAQESRMKGLLASLWEDQKKEVYQNIDNTAKTKAISDKMLFDSNSENLKWLSVFGVFIREVVIDKAHDIFDFLGMPRDLDLTKRNAVNFLKTDGVKFIKGVNETTMEQLRKVLAEGVGKNESIPELKRRVDRVYDFAEKTRSEMIARSEVIRATNFATEEAYRQSEIVIGKEWLTALDERTCPFCEELDGKIIELSKEYYEVGDSVQAGGQTLEIEYEDVGYPPLHPGCRCTIIPVIK